MKPGHHQQRLLQHLLDHPEFAHGLHTQQITRKPESLIKMGYIDESWRVTEAGKSKPPTEQQQQQIQESSNEASQAVFPSLLIEYIISNPLVNRRWHPANHRRLRHVNVGEVVSWNAQDAKPFASSQQLQQGHGDG